MKIYDLFNTLPTVVISNCSETFNGTSYKMVISIQLLTFKMAF